MTGTARMSGTPVIRIRRSADRRSRIQSWNDTVAGLIELQKEYARGWTGWRTISKTVQRPLWAIVYLDLSELEAIEPLAPIEIDGGLTFRPESGDIPPRCR